MPDEIFAHPRLAAIYDRVDGPRDDLDHYETIIQEAGAHRVLDIGCGTGTLAVRLAATGHDVIGVDPAGASLAVARAKPHADRVRWIEGDATTLPPAINADLAVMTGNVAQVFTTDAAWSATLRALHEALRPGGHLLFETRRPEVRAWEGWDGQRGSSAELEWWCEVLDVSEPLVTFRWSYRFPADGETDSGTDSATDGEILTSVSTLRFRTQAEVEGSLAEAGFVIDDVRDAPDRPGLEMVFVTHRPG